MAGGYEKLQPHLRQLTACNFGTETLAQDLMAG